MTPRKIVKKKKDSTVDGQSKAFRDFLIAALRNDESSDEPTLVASITRGKASIVVNPILTEKFLTKTAKKKQ